MKLNIRISNRAGLIALCMTLLIISQALHPATSSYAATPITVGGKAVVTNTGGDTIRVREGAGKQHEQISEAYEGDTVSVLAGPSKDDKGIVWYKVQTTRGTGWMMAEFLEGKGGASAPAKSTAKAAPAAPSTPKLAGFAKVANTDGDNLRVRAKATRSGSVIAKLAPNTTVAVKGGPVVDGEKIAWYQVSANGTTGWAMAQYLVQTQAPAEPAVVAAKAPAQTQPATQAVDSRTGSARGPQPPAEVKSSNLNQSIVSIALKHNGARYRFGGTSPSGFDCSGFVYYVVNKAGKPLARTIPGQIAAGTRISSKDLQPGDLVFFSNTYKRGLSHAGIYIGNGKMIHAVNERTGVMISNVWSAYWAAHYTTAVRLR